VRLGLEPERIAIVGDRPEALAEALARALAESSARVYLVTLPGLYLRDAAPSARALEIGHLPQYTDNPYVVAALADAYNAGLRELAPRVGATAIDVDAWSREALQPRDEYFSDSVHLTEVGQEQIGVQVARAIAPALARR
jgi:lysophospholipase L1-like esterase